MIEELQKKARTEKGRRNRMPGDQATAPAPPSGSQLPYSINFEAESRHQCSNVRTPMEPQQHWLIAANVNSNVEPQK